VALFPAGLSRTRGGVAVAWVLFLGILGSAQAETGPGVSAAPIPADPPVATLTASRPEASPGSAPPAAEASPFWPDVVDTVDVRARAPDRKEALLEGSGFGAYVPLGPDVAASRELGDLLDRLAGVHVHRYGGLGAFTLASVRGSTPGQVRIFLDDVPLASASDGFINLALLPVTNLDHAEVLRGPQGEALGGFPSAGSIRLFTPPVLHTPPRIAFGAGSFSTQTVRGQWGATRGPLGFLVSGQYRSSGGAFPYLDRNGTLNNPEDDRVVDRTNNAFEDGALLWKTRVAPARALEIGYTGQRTQRESGIPGTETLQTEHVRYRTERTRHQTTVSARPSLPGSWRSLGRPRVEAHLYEERIRDRYDNPEGEIGLGRASQDDRTRNRGARVSGSLPVTASGSRLHVSVDAVEERWTPRDLLRGEEGFARTRRGRTWALGGKLALLDRRLVVSPTYRWDRATDNYGGPESTARVAAASPARTYRFDGVAWGARLDLGRGLRLKGNRGRLVRLPTFPELFGRNGIQEGNPKLEPEQGIQWDAGISYRPRSWFQWETAYFESLVEKKIVLVQNSQRTVKAQNFDRAWVRGVESSLFTGFSLPARARLEVQSALTWQEARDVGRSRTYHGKRLPNLPETEWVASASVRRGPLRCGYTLSGQSLTYRDRYNSPQKKTEGYTIHEVEMECSVLANLLDIRLDVQNVGDRRVEDIDGFPLPGRTYSLETLWTY
jgi:hypothetical protein